MHNWSGDFKYFGEVGEAADYIGDFCKRWGRIFVSQTKEKYGEARVYCHFGGLSLHSFLFPGWCYKRKGFPQWLWSLDIWYLSKVFGLFTRLGFGRYQQFIYRLAYKRALKKWPMIREEIIFGADYSELLEDLWTKEDLRKQRDDWYKSYETYRDKHWRLQMRWDQLVEAVREGRSYVRKNK